MLASLGHTEQGCCPRSSADVGPVRCPGLLAGLWDSALLWGPPQDTLQGGAGGQGQGAPQLEGTPLWGGGKITDDLEPSFCLRQTGITTRPHRPPGLLGGGREPRRWFPASLTGLSLPQLRGPGREGLPCRAESQVSLVPRTCPRLLPCPPLAPGWSLLKGGWGTLDMTHVPFLPTLPLWVLPPTSFNKWMEGLLRMLVA